MLAKRIQRLSLCSAVSTRGAFTHATGSGVSVQTPVAEEDLAYHEVLSQDDQKIRRFPDEGQTAPLPRWYQTEDEPHNEKDIPVEGPRR
jgi:hypothetical protein